MKIPELLALAVLGSVPPATAAAAVYQVEGSLAPGSTGETSSLPVASTAALLGILGTTLLVRRRLF